jgi:putative transposase
VFKEGDAVPKPAEQCRKHGICEATYYNWNTKFGGVTISDTECPKELELENNELIRLLTESMQDNSALKDLQSRM